MPLNGVEQIIHIDINYTGYSNKQFGFVLNDTMICDALVFNLGSSHINPIPLSLHSYILNRYDIQIASHDQREILIGNW